MHFLGYPSSQKGYRLFNLILSRISYLEMSFFMNVFPYSSHTSGSSSCPLPVIPVDEDCPSIPYASPNPSSMADADMSSLPSSLFPSPPPLVPVQPTRKSTRFTSKPPWLKDFEPHHYKQAVLRAEWVEAMHQELLALEKNDTWEVVPLPPGKTAIGCKWVYKLKLKDDAVTFVYSWPLLRPFWPLQQLDINNAFLHGFLDEEIFMRPPEGYSVAPGMVCRLKRSLYDAGLLEAKSVTTPFPLGLKLSQGLVLSCLIQSHIGAWWALLYLGFTRPDISYCVQQLSQFIHHPCEAHWRAALHVVRYLKGSPTTGLFFPSSSSFQLRAFCDADWASCSDSVVL
ncbi:UNVERIFIED_CONTAM: Retrovirus-related Pol polyprotein from transposon RE1 [Sesamum latifolium]|uniref:Retrovirus-related Pol polyprotein from transposon RE1 n=1 Tax=Sesamum latifolium TaxID=2727402 RepID=A0AAW2VD61_9LAMI